MCNWPSKIYDNDQTMVHYECNRTLVKPMIYNPYWQAKNKDHSF
jgi:hypothetical protein